jgi:hypothetical protein
VAGNRIESSETLAYGTARAAIKGKLASSFPYTLRAGLFFPAIGKVAVVPR